MSISVHFSNDSWEGVLQYPNNFINAVSIEFVNFDCPIATYLSNEAEFRTNHL